MIAFRILFGIPGITLDPRQKAQQRRRARTTTLRTSYRAGECLSPCARIQGLVGQLWTITFYLHRSAAASMVPESKSKPSWILAGSECHGRSSTNLQPSQLGEHNRETCRAITVVRNGLVVFLQESHESRHFGLRQTTADWLTCHS